MARVQTGLFANKVPWISGGSGERTACVFPGANALFRRLDEVADPARHLRQVSPLLPDHRITMLGYAGSGFGEIVDDMARAMPAAPDVVIGISFGGFVALRFAAQYPELVNRLVLLVAAHRFSSEGWARMQRQFHLLAQEDLEGLVRENAMLFRRAWYNWLVGIKLWKDRTRLRAAMRAPDAIARHYGELFGAEFERTAEYAARIVCPTLIVGGTADQFFDRAAFEHTARLIPGAELRLYEDETHMLPIEKSGDVSRAIADFLRRTDASVSD